jgi:hypothetical protein
MANDAIDEKNLSDVERFFLGELEWDQLNLNDQRTVRDELAAAEANETLD